MLVRVKAYYGLGLSVSGGQMKRKLMDILACPVCKYHPLELVVKKEDEKEVLEGTIRCPKCSIDYPIEDGIPNMLPPEK